MIDRIQIINLSTGHSTVAYRPASSDLQGLQPWLSQAIASKAVLPLPGPALAGYSASARIDAGSLWVAISQAELPILALVVVARSRQAESAWSRVMLAAYDRHVQHANQERPRAPWVAVIELVKDTSPLLHRAPLAGLDAAIAWAWLTLS